MNEPEKITPAQISESQENLKAKYELEIEAAQQANLGLKKTLTDKDEEIFELQKTNKKLVGEVEDWKTEAHRNRRIEKKKNKLSSKTTSKPNILNSKSKKEA